MSWYNLRHKPEEKTAVINMYGQIGKNIWDDSGVSAQELIDAVTNLDGIELIDVNLSSPGGNYHEGLSIYNFLKRHDAEVNIYIDGEASSIASVIALSGTSHAPENITFMIHDPAAGIAGVYNAEDLKAKAVQLEGIKDRIVAVYVEKTGLSDNEVYDMMRAETFMSGKEAQEKGFIDNLLEPLKAVASSDFESIKTQAIEEFKNIGAGSGDSNTPPDPQTPDFDAGEVITLCSDAGLDYMAANFVKTKAPMDAIKRQIEMAQRTQSILAAAGLEGDAKEVIGKLDKPDEALQVVITNLKAEQDQSIDPTHSPQGTGTNGPDYSSIYNKRRKAR